MKKLILCMFALSSSIAFANTTVTPASSQKAQIGYSFGYLMGKTNANSLNDLDIDSFISGFRQGYAGTAPTLSNEQMVTVLSQYKKQVDAANLTAFQRAASQNLQEGNAFLNTNRSKAGVRTTTSGLQYVVITQGNGQKPTPNSRVEVHYEGRLLDGTVFDSSIARDEPVTFPLNQVIKGWQEGLVLMPQGSKYRFFVPAKLAYGDVGAGESIPPNSVLIFDIELLKVL